MFMEKPPRKLSEVLRDGMKLRPKQCVKYFFDDGGSCALGAIYEALTGRTTDDWDEVELIINLHFPEITDQEIELLSDFNDGDVDGYVWTREEIADWLEARGK